MAPTVYRMYSTVDQLPANCQRSHILDKSNSSVVALLAVRTADYRRPLCVKKSHRCSNLHYSLPLVSRQFRHGSDMRIQQAARILVQRRNVRSSVIPTFSGRVKLDRFAQSRRTLVARCMAVNAFQTISTLPFGAPSPPLEVTPFEEDDDGT